MWKLWQNIRHLVMRHRPCEAHHLVDAGKQEERAYWKCTWCGNERPSDLDNLLDGLSSDRECGLADEEGEEVAHRLQTPPIQRVGHNHWVTCDLRKPWPGEEGIYFEEQRLADLSPPKTCPNTHQADFKPTVGTHVCQFCGLIYVASTDQWVH